MFYLILHHIHITANYISPPRSKDWGTWRGGGIFRPDQLNKNMCVSYNLYANSKMPWPWPFVTSNALHHICFRSFNIHLRIVFSKISSIPISLVAASHRKVNMPQLPNVDNFNFNLTCDVISMIDDLEANKIRFRSTYLTGISNTALIVKISSVIWINFE